MPLLADIPEKYFGNMSDFVLILNHPHHHDLCICLSATNAIVVMNSLFWVHQ